MSPPAQKAAPAACYKPGCLQIYTLKRVIARENTESSPPDALFSSCGHRKDGKMKEKKESRELVPAVTKKPTRGRGGTGNFPQTQFRPETDEDHALVSKLIDEVLTEYKRPRVRSDEELAARLNDYFERCSARGQIPTVEEMAMSTGYSITTLLDWEHGKNKGFSRETSCIIKKAKDFLKTFDAKLVITGKMNFLAYCFRAKNYYGMADKSEVVLTPNNPLGDARDTKALEAQYIESVTGGDDR